MKQNRAKKRNSLRTKNSKLPTWCPVSIDSSIISAEEFECFGGIEELKDYTLIKSTRKRKLISKKVSNKVQKKKKIKKAFQELQAEKRSPIAENESGVINSQKAIRDKNSQITNQINKSDKSQLVKKKMKKKLKNKDKEEKMQNVEYEQLNDDNSDIKKLTDLSAWCNCFVPEPVLHALGDLGFENPTPIQELALPPALRDHMDILGAAETGSGKTLAFGIPIISHILETKAKEQSQAEQDKSNGISISESISDIEERNADIEEVLPPLKDDLGCVKVVDNVDFEWEQVVPNNKLQNPLRALILTPTRELAIQVKNHLQAIMKYTDLKIAVVVGGMSTQKQQRLLKRCPDIVVATPGRLWELIEEGEPHVNQVPNVRYLVIDEADRMVEKGHFAELTQILELINGDRIKKRRQTFVFSATLTLIHDLPKRVFLKKKSGIKEKMDQKQKLEALMKIIGMKDKPKVIDITKKTGTVETLTESQLFCSMEEKDIYLYYFVLVYPGRTLVFCNSIDCVRRLKNVFELLGCNPLPLHASMHQRQRLKNLERFAASDCGLLLATDVAARGLDIQGIEHVVHFQVPRTAEIYVHRSGRTARAKNEGLSLMLIDPQDITYYRNICRTLNKDKALPAFPVDQSVLKMLKERVSLVRAIDQQEHRMRHLSAQNRWFIKAAEEMDVDLDDERLLNDLGDERERAQHSRQLQQMKKKLAMLLKKNVVPKTFTGKYPTKSGKLLEPAVCRMKTAVKAVKNDSNIESSVMKKMKKKMKKKRK